MNRFCENVKFFWFISLNAHNVNNEIFIGYIFFFFFIIHFMCVFRFHLVYMFVKSNYFQVSNLNISESGNKYHARSHISRHNDESACL